MSGFLSTILPRWGFWRGRSVSVVRLEGVIGSGSRLRPGVTLAGLADVLERAFAASRAEAVALIINSPGGSPVQSMLIHKRIRALAEDYGKPVLAFGEDAMASGGYLIACAADEIYADHSSIVGSIGVVSAGFGFTGLMEKLGVERRLYTAGENKGLLDPFSPEKPEDVARLRSIQARLHTTFADLVRARRAGRLAESEPDAGELFSGAFWAGDDALRLGLIDGVEDLRSVLHRRYGTTVRLEPFRPAGGWLRQAPAGVGPDARLPGGFIDAGEAVEALESRAWWSRLGL